MATKAKCKACPAKDAEIADLRLIGRWLLNRLKLCEQIIEIDDQLLAELKKEKIDD